MAEVTEVHASLENVNDSEITILRWAVQSGQFVEKGQILVEAETSKASFEIEAPHDGYVTIIVEAGEDVPVGQTLCLLGVDPGVMSATIGAPKNAPAAAVPLRAVAQSANLFSILGESAPVGTQPNSDTTTTRFTKKAKALLEKHGLSEDLFINAGLVREQEVQKAIATRREYPSTLAERESESSEDLSQMWQVLDDVRLAPDGGWLLYSQDFIGRILFAGYGKTKKLVATQRTVTSIVTACVAFAQAIVWGLSKLPILDTWLEILARVYRRNSFGFFLRGAYYKAKIGQMGKDVIVDQHVEIWGVSNVSIGKGCHLDMYARLAAGEGSHGQHGRIEIGDHVHIGPQCQLAGRGGITIGSYTAITAGTKIFSASNVGENPDNLRDLLPMSHAAPLNRQQIYEAPVKIGHHAFIGLNVCILPGVTIGNGAIVNSGTVVTRNVPDYGIVSGNPAKITGYRTPRVPQNIQNVK